ncbi:MAG: hypothetical protein HYX41_00550 [Bdellovibrio sp.]|nr:hypothetical protein [Bdellovibrio sp.]
MQAIHLVFRAANFQKPLIDREHYVFLWNALCSRLKSCIALALMPNHGHLLVYGNQKSQALRSIRLSQFEFNRRYPTLWEPVPEPQLIPDQKHLLRQIRYVHLNPCRSRLTEDPLDWEFSTHRDYLGYCAGSITVPTIRSLGISSAERFHEFVSADSTTQTTGTPLPKNVLPKDGFPLVSLHRVADLALTLTRRDPNSLKKKGLPRHLFYALANAAGYDNLAQIGRFLGVTPQSICNLKSRGRIPTYPEDQARALLCDHRIRMWGEESFQNRNIL